MVKKLLVLIGILFSTVSFAQSIQDYLSIGLSFKSVPFQSDRLPALMLESHYYVTDRWATGGNLAYTRQKYGHAFGLDARRTYFYYFSMNWSNRFGLLQTSKLHIDANLDMGIIVATLRDRENYEWVDSEYYNGYYYVSTQSKVYDKLNRDAYFATYPNIGMSYKLFDLSKEEDLALHFTANAGYQLAVGGGDFTSPQDFNGFTWLLGFKIIGPTKE